MEGEEHNETDKFLSRNISVPKLKKHVEEIVSWLRKIGENGALERYFRNEKAGKAIPITKSGLRLYCHRVNDNILILGNGGKKTSQKAQDSPDAYPHFSFINSFIKEFNRKLRNGDISVSGQGLDGDLYFNIPDKTTKT
ncbi:MAG: hypothetical protein WBB45_20560 [Cyclobacteriaceae bacterium]